MSILLTGSSGFIGMNLLYHLAYTFRKSDIILLTSKPHEEYKCIIHNNYYINKTMLLNAGIKNIDIIIHLGAYTPKSAQDANDFRSLSNITSTENLLNSLPSIPRKFIYISTLDVYGDYRDRISENTSTIPNGLYGYSKLICEKMLEIWASKEQTTLQVLRLGHIYGQGEDAYNKLIPITIRKINSGVIPVIYSDGSEKRSFLHIKDCCKAITKSIELTEYEGPINIISKNAVSVLEIVNTIIKISKIPIYPKILNKTKQTKDFIFDNSKMERFLCEESILLEDGLKEEYEYFIKKQSLSGNISDYKLKGGIDHV